MAVASFTSRWRPAPLRASPVRAAATKPASIANAPAPGAAVAGAESGGLTAGLAGPAVAVWRLRHSLSDLCCLPSCKHEPIRPMPVICKRAGISSHQGQTSARDNLQ
jgi:hypothetical protein